MLLNNTLFDVDTLLSELQTETKGEKTALSILQRKLKAHYFDKSISNEDALKKLNNPSFKDFPRLQFVLQKVFSGEEKIEISEKLKDWEPTVTFEQMNQKYGYFNKDLSDLYKKLAIAGKKMTSLIERQAHDDEMAYKLMALFYDPNKTTEENFKLISQKFDKLITTKQDKPITTPYHDAFVTALHNFPRFSDVQAFDTWKSFIIENGFKSLDIFVQCAEHPAFADVEAAKSYLLQQKYLRANENPTLAKLCKELRISNIGFEAGLKEVQTGWPKKEADNLPIVDIQDSTGTYYWVKLPPQDMRALYLGNLIPGCCQHIGGDSKQCVKDGMRLSDNGFYVLLKSKKATAHSSRIIDNQINGKDYDIVAQSYAWMTRNGNLCLDSIEWNPERVSTDNIQDLMRKFSTQVFEEHPEIKYINVGVGGQTPRDIFPSCLINETMKQGYLYPDAKTQSLIAGNIPKHVLEALKERLKGLSPESRNTILYLAPYFDDIENVPAQLIDVIDELTQNLSKINLPSRLTTNDFRKIAYEDYQTMDEAEQSRISTICKLFNSQNEEELKQWLPTIPVEELSYISLMKINYSLTFKIDILQRLPRHHQLTALHQLDDLNKPLITQSLKNPVLFQMTLQLIPEQQRLEVIKEQLAALLDADSFLKMETLRNRILQKTQSLEHLALFQIALQLLPENQRLEAIKERNHIGNSILTKSTSHSEQLIMILELLPENQRLEAIQERSPYEGKSILGNATTNPQRLKMILELLPENQRLEAIQEKDRYGNSILIKATQNPKLLNILLKSLPKEITFVIENCMLDRNNFDQAVVSMISFISDMKRLASPDAIIHFVHAIINNQGVDMALEELLRPVPSNAFFKTNSKEAIQDCINKLDRRWLDRVPKLEHESQIIKPLNKA